MEQILFSQMSISDFKKLIEETVKETLINNIDDIILKSNETKRIDDLSKLMSVDEAAEFLHLSKPTIYSKVSRGEIIPLKNGKRLYFRKSDLIEFLEN